MKTSQFNKAIIYDDNCPMCQAYTKAFVCTGFLQKENRVPFSAICNNKLPGAGIDTKINWQRARHEIPLVDTESGNVLYGIDALAEVLQQKLFIVKPVLSIQPIRWFFLKLYKFFSYNRKVIVANYSPLVGEIDASPDYSLKWRIIFIAIMFSSAFWMYPESAFVDENWNSILAVASIIFSITVITLLFSAINLRKLITEILAQCSVVTFIASFLVSISFLIKKNFSLPMDIFYVQLAVALLVVLAQVVRRVKFLINEPCY